MERHALAILEQGDIWNWPSDTTRIQASGELCSKHQVPTAKLLYFLIVESQKFGGEVLVHFWKQLGTCDEKLKENIESLEKEDFVSTQNSFEALFRGLDPKNVNFQPVLDMAAEFFTSLGIAFLNPGGPKPGTSPDVSVSDVVNKETDELLEEANKKGDFGTRHQEVLKTLSFKRDGNSCLLTGARFVPAGKPGIRPTLAHIIPNPVHGKVDTLKCITVFAGAAARDSVMSHLNSIGNAMKLEANAHTLYDELYWGIEAKEKDGEIKYFFRMLTGPSSDMGYITMREGDEIQFGQGPEGKALNKGPIPILCNLRLAVAKVMKASTAADIILKWKDQADDGGCYHLSVASEKFYGILDAKLFLTGRAMIV